MRRLVILALGLLAGSCSRDVPNMICKAERTVQGQMTVEGPTLVQYEATDVFRVANGRLYHRYSGREEYLYSDDIREVETGRYVTGHMVFVLYGNRGFVMIGSPPSWTVTYLDCKS
jgi:hypothetical protein